MSNKPLGTPRPLWKVISLSVVTFTLYYGWYNWIIQEELRSQYWAKQQGIIVDDVVADNIPFLSTI